MVIEQAGREPIFAVLDQLIAECGPDVEEPEFAEGMTVADCIKQSGVDINHRTVLYRMSRGFSLTEAIYTPVRSRGRK